MQRFGQSLKIGNSLAKEAIVKPLLAQLVLLPMVGWVFRHALNPDGIAYLRIAHYYATGQTDLAISGYWGPMLSWLMAPILLLGVPPLATARVVMGLTAIAFFAASVHALRRFRLPRPTVIAGAWIVALANVLWSVENITPDLLTASAIVFAFTLVSNRRWLASRRYALVCGMVFGLAYLTKAVALPLAFILIPTLSILHAMRRHGTITTALQSGAFTLIGLLLITGPWVGILTSKYNELTLSTSAPIVHAAAGPGDKIRYPLGRELKKPAAGRIATWEDPSLRPEQYWSPLSSPRNALHQFRLIAKNSIVVNAILSSIHLVWPLTFSLYLIALIHRPWRKRIARTHWYWPLLPTGILAGLYLPALLPLTEQRYFYAALPWLFIASIGTLRILSHSHAPRRRQFRRLAQGVLVLSFLLPIGIRWLLLPAPSDSAWHYANELAGKLKRQSIEGPVAGSGILPRGRTGLYLAFHLNEPWYGDALNPTPDDFAETGASLVVVRRNSDISRQLQDDPRFRSLDPQLFGNDVEPASYPVQLFQSAREMKFR